MRHPFESRLTRGPPPLSTIVAAGDRDEDARGSKRGDGPARALLGDILDANLDQPAELDALRQWVRRALASANLRDSLEDDRHNALFGRPLASASRSSRAKHARKLNHGTIHLDD